MVRAFLSLSLISQFRSDFSQLLLYGIPHLPTGGAPDTTRRYGCRGMAQRRRSRGRSSSGSRGSRSGESEADKARIRGTAPSAADITKLELMEPSEEAKAHRPSDVDAMGQDKRRQVVGHSYGPSRRSQVMFFIAVAVALVVVVGGWLFAVSVFDQPPDDFPDKAPWSQQAATPALRAQQQAPPKPVDTPCGEPGNEYPAPSGSPCGPSISTEGKPTGSSGGQ
jgi:hypothetical protein